MQNLSFILVILPCYGSAAPSSVMAQTHSCRGVDPAQSVPQLPLDHKPELFLDATVAVEGARKTLAHACPEMG